MGATATLHLYIDDTGTRCPDIVDAPKRKDGMDHFAFGGYLIDDADAFLIDVEHSKLVKDFELKGPLHSTAIRCRKRQFAWLNRGDETVHNFYTALNRFVIETPLLATACVIDRPGYDARYGEKYGDDRWGLCKSAYSILIERSVKYAKSQNKKLAVYVEHTGKRENKQLEKYHQDIYENGMPFNTKTSGQYFPLSKDDFRNTLLKKPKFMMKEKARMQLADLVVYALAKGQYDSSYRAYQELIKVGKLIDDSLLEGEQRVQMGIKRYCFDR